MAKVDIPQAQLVSDVLFHYIIGTTGFVDETNRIEESLREVFTNPELFFNQIMLTGYGESPDYFDEMRHELGDKKFFAWVYNVLNMLKNQLKNNGYL